jgi:hypothetical protein
VLGIKFNVDTTDNVRLTYYEAVVENDINLSYHTLNGNNPQSNGNLIAYYEATGSGIVAADAKPLQAIVVENRQTSSNIIFEEVIRHQRDYAFAYVHGISLADLNTTEFSKVKVSSLLALPKGASIGPAYNVTLSIASKGDLVYLNYNGIPNTEPKDVAWVGIWKDKNLNFAKEPNIFYKVTKSGAVGSMRIDGLEVNTDYCLGYFLDGYAATKPGLKKNNLAAYVSFRTVF